MNAPKFTIISSFADSKIESIVAFVDSVRFQSVTDWEIILGDNASTGIDPVRTIEHFSFVDSRIRPIFNKTPRTIGQFEDEAAKNAHGDWIIFIESGATIRDGLLTGLLNCFADSPTLACILLTEKEAEIPRKDIFKPLGFAIRKEAYQRIGGINLSAGLAHRYDLILRAAVDFGCLPIAKKSLETPYVREIVRRFEKELCKISSERARDSVASFESIPFLECGWQTGDNIKEDLKSAIAIPNIPKAKSSPWNPFAQRELKAAEKLIIDSRLFDDAFYISQVPKEELGRLPPAAHFVRRGWQMGFDPNPLFDTSMYIERHPDVQSAKINPLEHYILQGCKEGRNPHSLFDTVYYMQENPDPSRRGINPLAHFLHTGWKENRNPHPVIDLEWIAAQRGPVNSNPLIWYAREGAANSVSPHPLFDASYYLRNGKSTEGIEPFIYYIERTETPGDKPHPLFDPEFYRTHTSDLPEGNLNYLRHFIIYGEAEQRQPHALFDPAFYRIAHGYLPGAEARPLYHFVTQGWKLGLAPSSGIDFAGWLKAQNMRRKPVEILAEFFCTSETSSDDAV